MKPELRVVYKWSKEDQKLMYFPQYKSWFCWNAIEISEYYEDTPKKKLSINQEAMKEVNELLGKSRKKKEPS